jgi:hypothetical protein
MNGSLFISEAELGDYVNASAQELYDVLVGAFQDYYLSLTSNTTLTSGQDTISLPADFYKLRGIDRLLDGGSEWQTVQPFSFAERNDRQGMVGLTSYTYQDSGIRYRLQGASIKLTPTDDCAGTYRVWYVPNMPALVADSDTFDGINGWEDYVVVDAAIKCLMKEESSTTGLERQKSALLKRIQDMSVQRDSGAPEVIVATGNRTSVMWWKT